MDSERDQGVGSFPWTTHLQLLMGRSGAVWGKKQGQAELAWTEEQELTVCHPLNANSTWAGPLPVPFLCS